MITSTHPASRKSAAEHCSIPCNQCLGTDVEQVGSIDRSGAPLRTVLCRGCGLVWTDPRPTPEETRTFYADEYRLAYKAAYTPKPKHAYRETLRALNRVKGIESILKPGQKLLDVGCGGGFFVYALNHHGVSAQGIEPNKGFAGYACSELKVSVQNAFLQDADFPENTFDVVTLNHVLEHVEDPVFTLNRLSKWIKPNGFLVVEVPNVEATYHAPRNRFHIGHLYNFNPLTLEGVGRRAGLSIHKSSLVTGANHLHTIFQRPASPLPPVGDTRMPDNYRRVQKILRNHTSLAHFTSTVPYVRAARKQWKSFVEWQQTRSAGSGREIVDSLIKSGKLLADA
ncbi:class I SAM-dependent methyltransferase [Planctomicrobium sp. SH661]|uniref:class I SAM-dependent methyltransferase n=1 Tax=Planctomicrobium sp. SH661 TaxID=3448124 RepID=UPI003F5AF2C8